MGLPGTERISQYV